MSAGEDAADGGQRARLEGVQLAGRTLEPLLANALTLTAGYCELLAFDPTLPDGARGYAREALLGVERALALVRCLRQLRSIELVAGRSPEGPVLRLEAGSS